MLSQHIHGSPAEVGADFTPWIAAAVGEMPPPLLWALAIVVFGVLLIVCVLLLLRHQPGDFNPWDAAESSKATTGRHLQHLHRVLRAIRAMNSVIVNERDSQQLLDKACRTLTATRGYKMAWIGLVEEGSWRVRPVSRAGFEAGYLGEIEVTWDDSPTGQGPTGRAIKSGEPSLMHDIKTAPEYRPWRQQALQRGYRCSAALPLRCRGQVMGALNVYSDIPDALDIEEVGLLQDVADHLAYALTSIRLEEELTEVRSRLRQSDRLRAISEHPGVGMITTDRDGIITSVNPAMLKLLGRWETEEEVVGRVKLLDLEVFAGSEARDSVERVLSTGTPATFESQVPLQGGRTRTLRCRGAPVLEESKELVETVWLVEDVSE